MEHVYLVVEENLGLFFRRSSIKQVVAVHSSRSEANQHALDLNLKYDDSKYRVEKRGIL